MSTYREIKGDLFSCDDTTSLAHCVSEDMKMTKGIAKLFADKFKEVEELKKQQKKTGDVAVLKHDNRYVYYLVTKEKYYNKPTYDTLCQSLCAMKKHCLENQVQHLAMPKIGCGLDRLVWRNVTNIIQEVFADSNLNITVYYI